MRLGKVSQRAAESVKHRIEELLECKLLNRPMEADLAQWVARLHPRMAKKFAAVGLIAKPDALAGPTLQSFINEYITARSDIKPRSVNRLEGAGKKLVECFGPDRVSWMGPKGDGLGGVIYDPTNGTTSGGDIWYFDPVGFVGGGRH